MSVQFRDNYRPARVTRPNRKRRRRPAWPWVAALVALAAVAVLGTGSVREAASRGTASNPDPAPEVVRCALEPLQMKKLPVASALLLEAETGMVLYEQNADEVRSPASLVKMMVQLVVFEDLEAGKVALGDSIVTSANASTMGGSQVYLKHGEVQTLDAMLDAIIISSANDAAMAVAEHLEGTEAAFVARMNAAAKRLGCRDTRFANVHGLDLRGAARNHTTARDLGKMASALVRHPKALEISSTWRKPFRGGEFWLNNTNKLLKGFDGLDGLKTGWTPRAGGCFVGTAERDGVRLVAVILKAPPGQGRFEVTGKLLEAGYRSQPRWREVARPGQLIQADWQPAATTEGAAGPADVTLPPAAAWGTLRVLLEDGREGSWRLRAHPDMQLPVREGEVLGFLDYRLGGRTVATLPARAGAES